MELLGTAINAAVIAVIGAAMTWLAKGKFDAADARMDRLEGGLTARIDRLEGGLAARMDRLEGGLTDRMDRLEGRLDRRIDSLEASIDGMRSDLTQVALAVGVRPRAEND